MKNRIVALAAALSLIASGALAQVNPPPQVQSIGPTDLFQVIVGGNASAQYFYAPATMVGGYALTQGGAIDDNSIVGGDFTTNLFQRGTSVAVASPTNVAYTADRWFVWSASTAVPITVTKQTGASDILSNYGASARVNKPSGAGVGQACIAQEVETVNSYRFQGQTAEFDFHAKAGATFSAASSNLAVYIITGTGTDEGATNLAFGLNAAGGGSSGWTGQASAASGVLVPLSTGGFNRYSVSANIPATATEIAVAICYTPVGTGSATDWFEFTGAQLVRNNVLAPFTATTGTLFTNDTRVKSFARRSQEVETALQQRYYYSLTEPATGIAVAAAGVLSSTTNCAITMKLPTSMRAAPTVSFTGTALSTSTWRIQDSTTSTLASTFLVAGAGQTVDALNLAATLTTASTAGWSCQLQGVGGGSIVNASAEL